MNKVPMTARGADKLREELNELKSVKRPAIIEAITGKPEGMVILKKMLNITLRETAKFL